MSRWDIRRKSKAGTSRTTGRIAEAAGSVAGRVSVLEALEPRVLLGGDHPSLGAFPNPPATSIVLDGQGRGSATGIISPAGDDDVFSFVAPANDFVSVLADTVNEATPDLNSRVEVYSATGTVLGQGSNNGVLTSGLARDGWVGFVAEAGETYYIRVLSDVQAGPGSTGTYTVRVAALSTALETLPPPVPPPFGPTPPYFDAEGIINQGLGKIRQIIDRAQQDVVFSFDVGNVAQVPFLAQAVYDSLATVNAQSIAQGDPTPAALIDTRLEIYNAQGQLIRFDSDSGNLNDAFLHFVSSRGEKYYFRLRADRIDPADPASTGAVELTFDMSASQVVVDPIVRYGGRSAQSPMGGSASGLGSAQETMMFSFVSQGTGLTIATVVPFGLPPLTDPAMRIIDDAGTLVRFNDDFSGLSSQIEVALPGGRTYYVIVDTFDNVSGGGFYFAVESNHTRDVAPPYPPGGGVDDRIPGPFAEEGVNRLRWREAFPLQWGAPFQFTDADFNVVLDLSSKVAASANGRIHGVGDRDLYMFTLPQDQLSTYNGNDDDAGTALYVGGKYSFADPSRVPFALNTRGLSIYDAFDYWYVGATVIDPRLGANPPPGTLPLGFNDNADTAATDGPEIYALFDWQPAGTSGPNSRVLVVGGDFDLHVPTNNPLQPLIIKNLAVWAFNPLVGRYVWTRFTGADPNGAVRAITVFDPVAPWRPSDQPPGEDPFDAQLFIGGDFTNLGPRVARRDGGAWAGVPLGITDGSVHAFAVFDPPTYSRQVIIDGNPQEIQVNITRSLFVGGSFTTSAMGRGLVAWDGTTTLNALPAPAPPGLPTGGVQGTVYALTVYDPPDLDDLDLEARLIFAGEFASAYGINLPAGNQNIMEWGLIDPDADPARELLVQPYGDSIGAPGGSNGPIYALHVWDPPDVSNFELDNEPRLAVGGAFTNWYGDEVNRIVTDNYFIAYPLAQGLTVGVNSTVRTITSFIDDQEPGTPSGQEVLYFGGQFTATIGGTTLNRVGKYFHNGLQFVFAASKSGVGNLDEPLPRVPNPNIVVYALSAFDDGIAGQWDRNDRPAARPAITVSATPDAFQNMYIRVYDSSGVLIYENNNTDSDYRSDNPEADQNPNDPAGAMDPSRAPTSTFEAGWVLPPMWGGETYYVEVGALNDQGTGRYTISMVVDAPDMPDVNGDGIADDINQSQLDVPEYGQWARTLAQAELDIAPESGDVTNVKPGTNAAMNFRELNVNPSLGYSRRWLTEHGNINSIIDTDVYVFRPNFTGQVEIRVSTTNIPREWVELAVVPTAARLGGQILTPPSPLTERTKTISSFLDSYLRIWSNDFQQLAYNDENQAVQGVDHVTNVGGNNRTFQRRDARIVFSVVAGGTYFVEVGSGARYIDGSPANPADRILADVDQIDWRFATGAYELVVHTQAFIPSDVRNGQTIQDDHQNWPQVNGITFPDANGVARASVIAIDGNLGSPTGGQGVISGSIINTPANLVDVDSFSFLAVARGPLSVTVARTGNSTLVPSVRLFSVSGGQIIIEAQGSSSTGVVTLNAVAEKGQRFFVTVLGGGGSEGDYTVSVNGQPANDEAADRHKYFLATEIPMRDFQGRGEINGNIEGPGDEDFFKFEVYGYHVIRATVTGLDVTLNPFLRVYEMTEDLAGNPVLTLIAFNDDLGPGTRDASITFPVNINRVSGVTGRAYPYYFIQVSDANPNGGFGRYTLTLTFPISDDHPDAGEWDFATPISIDPTTGAGTAPGELERVGDSDLLRFTPQASGAASVAVTLTGTSTLRPRLTIYDQDRTTVLGTFTGPDAPGSEAVVNFTVQRGRIYYVLVDNGGPPNDNTAEIGTYLISVTSPPLDDYPNEGEFSIAANIFINPNTGRGTVGTTTPGLPANPRLNPAGDTDLFTFVAIANGDIVITITPFDTALGRIAARLTVFDAGQNQVAVDEAGAPLGVATITLPGVTAGTRYYILVAANTGAPGSDATGEYHVVVQGPPPPDGGGDDPGFIDFTNPRLIALSARTGDGQVSDVINVPGDRDLFTFFTSRSGRVFVQVVTPTGSLLNARVTILSAPNELPSSVVTQDSDGIPGATADVSFLGAASTQYWVIVSGIGTNVGSYTIKVNTVPVTNQLVYPEGFATTLIHQYVSVVNPNNFDVNYSVVLRYEDGTPDFVAYTGIARANRRDPFGVTIIDGAGFRAPGLTLNTPYAVILESDGPIGATFAHYDHGATIGEALTEVTSAQWSFARVERNPGSVLNFIVLYNPNPFEVTYTFTAYQNNSTVPVSISRTVAAFKRSGLSINDRPELPFGIFGGVVTAQASNPVNASSFIGIVASISHYNLVTGAGWGALGDPDGGATRGVFPSLTEGSSVKSQISFLNPTDRTITVRLEGTYIRTNLPNLVQIFDVQPFSSVTLTGSQLGLVPDQPAGFRYSTINDKIVASANQSQLSDGDSTNGSVTAGTRFFFGDAFLNTDLAGQKYFETLNIHNPTNAAANVSVKILFLDGTSVTTSITVGARGFGEVRMHELPALLNAKQGNIWYSVDVTSLRPIVATFSHYDLTLGGGWTASGTAFGIAMPLSQIP